MAKRKMKETETLAEMLAYKPYDPSNLYLWSPLPQDAYFGPKGQNKWIADLDIPRWNLVWVLLDKDPRKAKIKNHEALLERVEKDIQCVGIYEYGGQRRTVHEILCEEPNQAQMDMEKNYDWIGDAPSFFTHRDWFSINWPNYPTAHPQHLHRPRPKRRAKRIGRPVPAPDPAQGMKPRPKPPKPSKPSPPPAGFFIAQSLHKKRANPLKAP